MCTRFAGGLLVALVLAGCPQVRNEEPPMTVDAGMPEKQDFPQRTRIYQLLVRTFGNDRLVNKPAGTIEENGSGKFEDIDAAAIAAIRELGMTHVWLTGVLRQSSLTAYPALGLTGADPDVVKGRAGSPYAVEDWYDVSPDYAREPARRLEEFDALVARLHGAGLKVIIDLVPNHVARSYASITHGDDDFGRGDDPSKFFAPDNAFFYLVDPPSQRLHIDTPAGWIVPGLDGAFGPEDGTTPARTPKATGNNQTNVRLGPNDWYETVKLNWGFNFANGETRFDPVPKTWQRFDRILAFWQARGVDGFRADFAHYVPAAAWKWLLGKARERKPEAFFFAEAYDAPDRAPGSTLPGLVDAGFDAVYDDPTYDTVREIFQGSKWANDLDGHDPGDPMRHRVVRYAENHDERRAASPLVPGDCGFGSGEAGLAAAALLYLSANGPILFHAGQELGEPGAGAEGFGGDDGRTSIFDYWSVSTLAAFKRALWKPAGLDARTRTLRQRYADLLHLANDPVFTPLAGYYGLSFANQQQDAFGERGHWMTAFLRHREGATPMLVVANLDPTRAYSPQITIPGGALALIGRPSRLVLSARFGGVVDTAGDGASVITVTVPAMSVGVWALAKP